MVVDQVKPALPDLVYGKLAAVKYMVTPIYKGNDAFSIGLRQGRLDASSTFVPRIWLKNAKGVIVYPGFPADVLFNFRLYSIAAQLVLWGAIGLIFAPLADRLLAPGPARAELRNGHADQ